MKISIYIFCVFSFLIFTNCCVAQSKSKGKEPVGTVEIIFTPMAGKKPLYLDSIYLSPNGEKFSIKNIKFFISDIGFSRATGIESPATSTTTQNGIALINFKESNYDAGYGVQSYMSRFTVKEGNYSDIRFNIGLPRQVNHADPTTAPAPLDLGKSDMYWEWNSGYIFLLIEGKSEDAKDKVFHFAIGNDSRIMPISFGNIFNVTPLIQVKKHEITRVNFSFDINKLLTNVDGTLYSFKTQEASVVHGGYFADIFSMNARQALEFVSVKNVNKD